MNFSLKDYGVDTIIAIDDVFYAIQENDILGNLPAQIIEIIDVFQIIQTTTCLCFRHVLEVNQDTGISQEKINNFRCLFIFFRKLNIDGCFLRIYI